MADKSGKIAADMERGVGHIPPVIPMSVSEVSDYRMTGDGGLLRDYANTVFPYRLDKYPGMIAAASESLGLSVSSYKCMAYENAVSRVSLPLAIRAGKILRAKILELTRLAERFEAIARAKAAKPRTGSFLQVRVRDSSGIPRNARGRGNGNAPGF